MIRRTSASVSNLAACKTEHSRAYLSTKIGRLEVLKDRFIHEQFGQQPLEAIEAINFEVKLPASAIVIDLARIVPLSPVIVFATRRE